MLKDPVRLVGLNSVIYVCWIHSSAFSLLKSGCARQIVVVPGPGFGATLAALGIRRANVGAERALDPKSRSRKKVHDPSIGAVFKRYRGLSISSLPMHAIGVRALLRSARRKSLPV